MCQGYDGVNEIVEDNQSGTRRRYYVHGASYIDERLMMYRDSDTHCRRLKSYSR